MSFWSTIYNMSGRVVSDIQTRAEKWLKKRLILWVHWRSNFKNKCCLSRENQSWSLCKSGQIFIRFTNIDYNSFLLYFPRELLIFKVQYCTVHTPKKSFHFKLGRIYMDINYNCQYSTTLYLIRSEDVAGCERWIQWRSQPDNLVMPCKF